MRVLIASTGGAGHFNPLLPFVEALKDRGDQVLIVVPPELKATVEAMGQPFEVGAAPPQHESERIWKRMPMVSPRQAAVLANRELFGRLCTAAMLPTLERVCGEWGPDLVLREPCEYSSAIAADHYGIRHAQVGVSLANIESSSLELAGPALKPYSDKIVEKMRAAPYLTRFPATLDPSPFADTRRFKEPAALRHEPLPDWWDGNDAPLVYVTFGSVAGGLTVGAAAYRAALDALDGLDSRVLLTLGHATDVVSLGSIPPNVHIEAWVPQGDVLETAALVVCHGGSATTFGALASGVPVLMVPMWADQPSNARAVAAAGAGLVVVPSAGGVDTMRALGQVDGPRIRAAIESVLSNTSFQWAASRIADEMRASPTIDVLLDALESDPWADDTTASRTSNRR